MRRAIVGFFTSALIVAGCRECGKDECSAAMPARCEGNTFVWCEQTSAYGHQFKAKLIRNDCGPNNQCVQGKHGEVAGCARKPVTPCDPATYPGGCDGDMRLMCTTLSTYSPDNFVAETGKCLPGTVCAAAPLPFGPQCVKPDVPCTLPAGKDIACVGSQFVLCANAAGKRIEGLKLECSCKDDTDAGPRCTVPTTAPVNDE